MNNFTRREIINKLFGSSVLMGAAFSTSWSHALQSALDNEATRDRFLFGVASGDPTHKGVVLWTRLNLTSEKKQRVKWKVSEDPSFKKEVRSGKVKTSSESDYSVKVEVKGLKPGKTYYYKFIHDGVESEPGRTRTLPKGQIDQLGLALVSCSNFPFGYFNTYEAIANDEKVEFVVHLGDYIYEYGEEGYGGKTGKELNRNHLPAHETVSLHDYRLRHAQYKSDVQSRKMHAAHPIIVLWDDHESANNPYMGGAQNHQDDEGSWEQRKTDSLQAYYEWMPIRDPKRNTSREEYWRVFEFGDLATMISLETRHTGRSKQIDYAEHLPSIDSIEKRNTFVENILGNPDRTMLSEKMHTFLKKHLSQSVKDKKAWRLIANQIPMARTHVPKISEEIISELNVSEDSPLYDSVMQFKALGELDLPIYTDTWDGYPVAREAFYQSCNSAGAEDLLVFTGDSHAYWFNALSTSEGKPMGYEIGTTGVTSPGDFEYFGQEKAELLDSLVADANDEIIWTNNTAKGYVRVVLNEKAAHIDYLAVSDIKSRNYELQSVKHLEIASGNQLKWTNPV